MKLSLLQHRKFVASALLTVVSVGWFVWKQTPFRKPDYIVTDLGKLSGFSESVATDINNQGQVIGWCRRQDQKTQAFLWQKGAMTDLGMPKGSCSKALSLNDKGQIVGWSGDNEEKACHAFLWSGGKARALGTLPYYNCSIASGINKFGDISGWAFGSKQGKYLGSCGFVRSKGKITAIPNDKEEAEAHAINNKRQVVGYAVFIDIYDAFLYQDGQRNWLRSPVGRHAQASAINNHGAVVGASWKPGDIGRACLWERGADGDVTDLGTLGSWTYAADINDNKQVVGWSYINPPTPQNQRAFLWKNGKMENLQEEIPADSGWILTFANAINNRGQIVGTGKINGESHAFLLTPL